MTHILMAFTSDGELIAARPVLCKDADEDLAREKTRFMSDYVDEDIGDTCGVVSEEDLQAWSTLNDGETQETGI